MSCSSMRCTPAVYVYVFVPVACVSVCTLFAFSSQLLSFSFHTHMAAPLLVAGKGIDGPPCWRRTAVGAWKMGHWLWGIR